ncbi:MAG: HD-GYP domain-containing protein [Gemmatimonadota bacterium]|nr:HD-GYP domain-containing protein [Gemmatimonadota bacterium]
MDGDRRILALLAGEDPDDQNVREALVRLEMSATLVEDVTDLAGRIAEGGIHLVLCDARAADPGEAVEAVESAAAASDASLPVFLPLIDPPLDDRDAPEFQHFLARPFRAETLTALCRELLEDAGARNDESTPISVRRPARFSARPLYADAVTFARESFVRAGEGLAPDMGWAALIAERVHTSLLQSNLLLNRALEPYKRFDTPTHCVNVAIFGGRIALSRDLPLEETLRVVQAGLVHDIGMARLPDSILKKEARLSEEERGEMQRHPVYGAELIAELGTGYAWLERAVRQEHERIGGQGYPDGLEGEEIDDIAQIVGLSDVFEAFSHNRTYRSPFTAYEALERVVAMRETHFDPANVDALASEISVFPLDSYVQLSSGAIGRVIATNPDNLMRPTIEVLWNESWSPVDPRVVALEAAPELSIERPLHESEVPIT